MTDLTPILEKINADIADLVAAYQRPAANDKHCDTCTCGKRAAVQPSRRLGKCAGSIEWWEHEAAYAVYASRYGTEQSAQRIHERAGFSYSELIDFLGHEPTTWRPLPSRPVEDDTNG